MSLSGELRMVSRNLMRAPGRSTLTTLGVIIGIAAVITALGIGGGAKKRVEEALTSQDSRFITLIALRRPEDSSYLGKRMPITDYLRPDDYYAIRESVQSITASTPQIFSRGVPVQGNGRVAEAILEGIDVDGFRFQDRELIAGSHFGSLDVSQALAVSLVTESLAHELFSDSSAIGRSIRVRGVPFTIIGVVSDVMLSESVVGDTGRDLHAFVPYTSYLRRIDRKAGMSIAVQADGLETVGSIETHLMGLMEQRRGSRNSEFRTHAAVTSINAYAEGSQTMSRLLAAIAAVSLIVGGIGIMNIMLVSVSERTHEIGIRIAIGTRPRRVMRQFLIEASSLSALGGIVGVGVGLAATGVVARVNEWPVHVSPSSVIAALLCSAAIGIFFGYHPARRASLLDPIETIRSE